MSTKQVSSSTGARKPRLRAPQFLCEMRSALIARLEALHAAYTAMQLPELAERVRATPHIAYRTVDPDEISDAVLALGRAVEGSCITPAAQLADGLFGIAYGFGLLADGIREKQPTSWRRGCRNMALDAAREMAERMAEEVQP